MIDAKMLERFKHAFGGRTDAWGALRGQCIHEDVTQQHFLRHLVGKTSLGIYPLLDDGRCHWATVDIDIDDLGLAVGLRDALRDLGLNAGVYIERSKSRGFHIWVLFDELVSAKDVRRILRAGLANAKLDPGTEVFPKQNRLDDETPIGNYVHLPYYGDNGEGRRTILRPHTLDPMPLEEFLDGLQPFPASSLELVLETLPPEEKAEHRNPPGWLGELMGSNIPTGQRRPTLTKIAGAYRAGGIDVEAAVIALTAWAEKAFEEPLPEEEIEKTVRGIYERYGIRIPTADNGTAPGDVHEDVVEGGDPHRLLIDAGDGDLARVASLAWKAILGANEPPVLYRRGSIPAWIEADDVGAVVVREVTLDRMRFRLARIADWYRDIDLRGGKQKRVEAFPPIAVVRDLLVTPDPPLPVLNRIVEAPVYGPDGTLQTAPGYHPSSRTYYAPEENINIDDLPDDPTSEDVTAARKLILGDLLVDFPFVGYAEMAHAVALMILPFVRDMITGPTPLHLIEKPTQGTGGSLLADVLTIPALGRPATAMTEARDEDEWRKRITARLMGGPSIILVDNLHRRLESAALSAVLTAETWEDRILGRSETTRIPVRCAWVATGNNPALSGEIARRTVRIRLDAKMDRPWQRKDFRHPDLRRWAKQHRAELARAALIMVTAWLAADRPTDTASLGGFESWSDTIGGILATAKIPGFLGNLEDLYEQSDAEGAAWRAFVQAWWDKHEDKPVGVATLWDLINQGDLPIDLGKGSEHGQKVNLGREVKSRRDRQLENLRIIDAGTKRRAQLYRLERVSLG